MADFKLEPLARILMEPIVSGEATMTFTEETDAASHKLLVTVSAGELGRLIGTRGATAQAIRRVLDFGAAQQGRRCSIDVVES